MQSFVSPAYAKQLLRCGEADTHLALEFLSPHLHGAKVWQHLKLYKRFNNLPFAVQIRQGPEF